MSFWEMFNNHPFIGLVLAVVAIIVGGLSLENVLNTTLGVLRLKYGGCDCVPCDREHVEEEPETETGSKEIP